ncbi:MmgE/PrpD family protein [Polaromonas sp. YR568]|uniref:MmgE/PrpD family protein n=1 Tax=Polaromonas sp. YR568 TaxID=1855301 RepID=UPI003137B461
MPSAPPSPTQTLADWVVQSQWSNIDATARTAASRSLLNWLGCALGGASDAAVDQLLGAVQDIGSSGRCPLLGRSETTDPGTAALVHAFASNILDYDDTHWATAIHPAGTVASALVALAGHTRISGKDFLHAFLLGMEVECRIGMAVSPGHYEHGWHITATCGVFGAAVAAGKVMRLSAQQMAWALGHAATQSSGLVASLGSMAKSLNIGHAARNGLLAAQWAKHGMTANHQALETRFGFAEVMGPRSFDSALYEGLGQHWEAERNTFKPYPCGFLLHPALDACLAYSDRPRGDAESIERVVIAVHPLAQVRADRPHPGNGLESKLSLQHAVAVALLRGDAGVRAFTDAAANDPELCAFRDKIRLVSDENLTAQDAHLEVHLHGGQHMTSEVRGVPGQSPLAMSDALLERKFHDLVSYGAPHCDAPELLQALQQLPQTDNVAELFHLTLRRP